MFNQGIQRLLQALPGLAGLPEADVRTMLSGAWLEAVDHRDFAGQTPDTEIAAGLRRLATAVEVRLFIDDDLAADARRASAFVAAEALGVVRDLRPSADELQAAPFGSTQRFEMVEESLLYLTAGFDANAALTAQQIGAPPPDHPDDDISEWALSRIRTLLDHARPLLASDAPVATAPSLRARVRHELWRRIGAVIDAHVRWLRMLADEDPAAADALLALAADLRTGPDDRAVAASHPDLHHLCLLLAGTCTETAGRALRRLPSPPDDGGRFATYQRNRAKTMPLLWPAAALYADQALPGPEVHAVVAVPTGAGKSSVAELAIAQAVRTGWVLYLAPTNALVAQARRDLRRSIGRLTGVTIRTFTGGAEYTRMSGETLEQIADSEVLVMTPEKCSLALRQNPEAFASLSLCVLDEAHLIGDARSRGVVAELVIAEVLHRSPAVRVLLLSALVDDPQSLADWLQSATGTHAIAIDEPWRPTRTLRALCGVAAEDCVQLAQDAAGQLADLPPRRKNVTVQVPLRLLGALHGAWTGEQPGDYAIVDPDLTTPAKVNRSGNMSTKDHTAPTTRVLTQALADTGHRVLVFLPADRNAPFSPRP